MPIVSYLTVYKRALAELKDPQIKVLLNKDKLLFCEVMYNFLENAIPLFTNPFPVVKRLKKRQVPDLYEESLVADGFNDTFKLQWEPLPDMDFGNAIFQFSVDKEIVNGKYDADNNTVILDITPFEYQVIDVKIYSIGGFDIDLFEEEIYILSQWVVVCWAEYINNNKLDIDRLLGDADFKLTSNAPTTNAKTNWYYSARENASKRMEKYAWDAQMQRLY